jgi:arabinogalactan endo-1,4-beta-galactosidase
MKIYLDIMYSDFWADPQHQNIPAAWQGQNLSQLTATVGSYSQQVISAFARQGTPVDMVSIGNEIRNGILWPIGEVNCTSCGGWDNLAQLLKAGVAGAQAGNPAGHKMLVMMHYDQGGNAALSDAFFSQLTSLGVPFDVIGLSYYPFFHGSISAMRATVDGLATTFGKPIVIAETQYAWTLANGNSPLGDSTGDFVWQTSQPGWPAVVRDRRAVHPRERAARPGGRAVLLGTGLDSRRAMGARYGHRVAERQPHPVRLRRCRLAVGGDLR